MTVHNTSMVVNWTSVIRWPVTTPTIALQTQ